MSRLERRLQNWLSRSEVPKWAWFGGKVLPQTRMRLIIYKGRASAGRELKNLGGLPVLADFHS